MVAPFEARTRPLADWEHTILTSFVVWRQLIAHESPPTDGVSSVAGSEYTPSGGHF